MRFRKYNLSISYKFIEYRGIIRIKFLELTVDMMLSKIWHAHISVDSDESFWRREFLKQKFEKRRFTSTIFSDNSNTTRGVTWQIHILKFHAIKKSSIASAIKSFRMNGRLFKGMCSRDLTNAFYLGKTTIKSEISISSRMRRYGHRASV